MQLNKYLAYAGISSRRKAVELIQEGSVSINNGTVYEPAYMVKPTDAVRVNKKVVTLQNTIYILINKPKGYITSTHDGHGRATVLDLLGDQCKKYRLYPVGRLDCDTTGLLLITNDGTLAQSLSHPRYEIRKTYLVTIDKTIAHDDYGALKKGMKLEDGFAKIDDLVYLNQLKTRFKMTLHSGKNRIIKRLFAKLGYDVIKLDRIGYAHLTKKELPIGRWRFLTKKEVAELQKPIVL